MTSDAIEFCDDSFVAVALRHGLLQSHHVEQILSHARQIGVQPSDAALTLSMLELHEVDAINLLCRPAELATGYVLSGLIGCGAGGLVFRARQTTMDREVALKTINLRSRNSSTIGQARIQRESLAIARLHHPHIVTAFDSGFYQGRFCIAMELVEGETLADFIARHSSISETIAWSIARQVASALAHANVAGVTHRDIKPANLLLCEAPQGMSLPAGVPFVKVADFGLALQDDVAADSHLTATGITLGTPAYVAPEQLQDTHVDARADIYSLGATVYHMLTGLPPCSDRSPMRTIMQKTIGDDRWRNDLPEWLSASTVSLFRDMTEKDPDDRISDYQELITRIDEWLAGAATNSAPTSTAATPASLLASTPSTQTPDPSGADPSTNRRWIGHWSRRLNRRVIRRVVVPAAITVLVAAAAVGGIGLAGRSAGTVEPAEPIAPSTRWTINGLPDPLFNGKSVPLYRQSGGWSTGVAGDGSRVLVGQEESQMTIPLKLRTSLGGVVDDGNLRLRLGVMVSSDSRADISVLVPSVSADAEFEADPNAKIEGAVLRFDHDSVTFVPADVLRRTSQATAIRKMKLPSTSIDESAFQRVSVHRRGGEIVVFVNGSQLGRIVCDEADTSFIRLRCTNNSTSFADIDVVPITPVMEATP